ncbi:MAG TPA: serine/threonine-protein kinase, partial [Planctomycetaceae bacterium]|nr:serine/threonine-protein kinase [Planctomycetaceae bacterium]
MTVTFQEFCDQLVENALMSEFGIAAVLSTQDHPPQTSDEFANLLIHEQKLTKYQARMLLDGKGQSLTLGVYLIKDKLGLGGMGQVYLAEHMRMKRKVALKVLSPEIVKNSSSVLRFHREVEAVAQLNHKNIVTAYDANEDNGTHFLVMEYIPGCDLATSVKRNGPFAVARALDAIEQMAAGLAYAHERGVVHRDVKPSNLMLDSSGTIKILDLGLARIKSPGDESDQNDLTDPGMVMGTVDYMAPEQALDSRSADAVSDIYSLGCCLFYLLTGRSLFRESTAMQRLIALQNQPAPTLSENRSDIPAELEATYQKLIAKDPRERFQSMTEVIDAIRKCRTLVEAQPAPSPALKEGEAQ